MKRFKIDIERSYGTGIYDGDEYADLRIRNNQGSGDLVKWKDAKKLINQIKRMQKRLDKHEGRINNG